MFGTRLDVERWRRRHAAVLTLLALQALGMSITTIVQSTQPFVTLLAMATLLVPAIATALPRTARATQSVIATGALVAQAPLVVFVQGSDLDSYALFLSGLCAVALYERTALFAAAFVAMTAIGVTLGVLAPEVLAPGGGPEATINTVLSGTLAMTVGALAIGLMWQESLRTRESSFERLATAEAYMDISESMLIVLDRSGTVLRANRRTALAIDRELEDIVGVDWFEVALAPETREASRTAYLAAFDGDNPIGSDGHPVTLVSSLGERRTIAWWSTMLLADDGSPQAMVCAGTDITERLQAEVELERSRVELTALRRLAQKVASLDDARQAVVAATLELTEARMAAIAEPDRTGTKLIYTVSTEPAMIGVVVDLEDDPALITSAFIECQPQFIADLADDPRVNQKIAAAAAQGHARSALHQPIVGGGKTTGVLSVAWDEPVRTIGDRRAELATLIAHEASIALRRRASIDQLARAALVDPLTGVANRRAFDAELPRAIGRAAESAHPLALIVMDLNDFKAVNDILGHEAGDAVLTKTASAWAAVLRAGDMLARIGGDEFVVLLPDCDEDLMTLIVQRLRSVTPHAPGVSIGGCVWDGLESATAFIRRSDETQYADKAATKRSGERRGATAE